VSSTLFSTSDGKKRPSAGNLTGALLFTGRFHFPGPFHSIPSWARSFIPPFQIHVRPFGNVMMRQDELGRWEMVMLDVGTTTCLQKKATKRVVSWLMGMMRVAGPPV